MVVYCWLFSNWLCLLFWWKASENRIELKALVTEYVYKYRIKIIMNQSRTMSMNFLGYTYFLKEVIEFKPKESLCVWQKLIMEMYATAFKFKDEWVAFIIDIPIVCQEFCYQVMSCNF